jgi:hypothetical protein
MIHIEIDADHSVAVLRPTEMTRLTQVDFKKISDKIDGYLKQHDRLNGLLIVTDHFPGWENLKAFSAHLKLVKDHQKKINRVAIVSDSPFLTAAPHFVDHFIMAKVRHFDLSDIETAREWAAGEDLRAGRFVVLDGYPEDVVAIRAVGTISRADYEETLIPLLKQKIKAHEKVKMLYWCGAEFKGFTAGAMWDDGRFGLMHLGDFSKLAFVSDVDWLRKSMKLFSPLVRMPVQVFHNADIEDAKKWITES